ncbi:MAG: 4Fe-4S cluster-binding domain-containing protein, partial [Alphaproteobacteria bacterium]
MNRVARRTLRSAADLAAAGFIRPDQVTALAAVGARYTIAVPPAVADLIDNTAGDDPIARQFVPHTAELDTDPQERADPIGDLVHEVTPGLIHRYPDRVLLKLVATCAVYCRFCFRREAVGKSEGNLGRDAVGDALDYIRARPHIWEVILSGGDPLVASVSRLAALLADLAAIEHVKVVRIHTRLPVVAPERASAELAGALVAPGVATWVAVHINHRR